MSRSVPSTLTLRPLLGLAATAALVTSLAGCSQESSSGGIAVAADEAQCKPEKTSLDSGVTTFEVKNTGAKVTELYVLRPNGSTVAERENILPGTNVKLTVELPAGSYTVRCRPGDIGEGIKTAITVTGSTKATQQATQQDTRLATAVTSYRAYVTTQAQSSLDFSTQLQAAIKTGDAEKAKTLYAQSRVGWETMEPVAEAFADLDPKMDLREADLEAGQTWTGWHVIEKALWKSTTTKGMQPFADGLVANLQDLLSRIPSAEITGTSMANGAKELLDEVATGKITGEEEAFSHLDLVDFQANVDGAKRVYDLLKPVVARAQPDLAKQLDTAFANIQKELDAVRSGSGPTGFPSYATVAQPTRAQLSAAVDALSEPLSHLAAAVAPQPSAG